MTRMRCAPLSHASQFLTMYYYQAIKLDPLSPWGYERKHAALLKAGEYDNAITAFETMLSKIERSPDPEICSQSIDIVLRFFC